MLLSILALVGRRSTPARSGHSRYPVIAADKVREGIGRKVGIGAVGQGLAVALIQIAGAGNVLVGLPGVADLLRSLPRRRKFA